MHDPLAAIEAELHQTRHFRSIGQAATVALLRTASVVRRSVARLVEPEGISAAQYNVLRILRGAGPKGLPTLEIRDRLIEEAPGITRLIDKLEGAGLVRRDRSGADRRQVFCRITKQGMALLERLDAPMDRLDDEVMGSLDEAQLGQLLTLLDEVRARHRALDEEAAPALPPTTPPRDSA